MTNKKVILSVNILKNSIVYNINWYDLTFELPKNIISFINKHWIGVRDLLDTKNETSKSIYNKEYVFDIVQRTHRGYKDRIYTDIITYSYKRYILNEYKLKESIRKILSDMYHYLIIYINDLEYWINNKNEIRKWTLNELFKDLKNIYIIKKNI